MTVQLWSHAAQAALGLWALSASIGGGWQLQLYRALFGLMVLFHLAPILKAWGLL